MTIHSVELLAPAGNAASLHAAVRAGADAVYLGLESFNARRGADNFTLDTLEEACAYAHLRGVSVYLTMNTILLPHEIDDALETARQAYRAGVDAFIVQDIGLADALIKQIPQVRIHASTQMNIVNAAGLRAAAALGVARVTLGRELSLGEIEYLCDHADSYGIEVEVFAHGALCVCYSGQCFMSSLIGGRSANRGLCAQACRLPYELHSEGKEEPLPASGEYLLSPKDLSTIDRLSELVNAGVRSLKIEGRMKSPDYVASVVSVYRSVLDRLLDAQGNQASHPASASSGSDSDLQPTEEQRQLLASAFTRGFTSAYLDGERGNEMMSYQRPNNRGVLIGRVLRVQGGFVWIKPTTGLSVGDVIEFWTKKGRSALTIAELAMESDGTVKIPLAASRGSVRQGDRVFRVRNAQGHYEDDALLPRIPITGAVTLAIGSPLRMSCSVAKDPRDTSGTMEAMTERSLIRRLSHRFGAGLPSAVVEGDVVEPARTKSVTPDEVRRHIDRLGAEPYYLADLAIDMDDGVGIGFSRLHHIRSEALQALSRELLQNTSQRVLERMPTSQPLPMAPPARCRVVVRSADVGCVRAALRAGADEIIVPVDMVTPDGAGLEAFTDVARGRDGSIRCLWALPTVCHDAVGQSRESRLGMDCASLIAEGSAVLADSLAAAQEAQERSLTMDIGPHLPVTNRLALAAALRYNIDRIWLSPELNLRQIGQLISPRPCEFGLTVIGAQELMITEHCLLMSQGPCSQQCGRCDRRSTRYVLRDRKGYEFPVITDNLGRSHLYNSVVLDTVPAIPELLSVGVTSFMVDATLMDEEETFASVQRVCRAVHVAQKDGNAIAKAPGTTSGHLHRGVA